MIRKRVKRMKWLEVEYSGELNGIVNVPGSKNSSLALMAASCLADEPVVLKGIPYSLDFKVIYEIGEEIGLRIKRNATGDMLIDPRGISHSVLDPRKTSAFRASYYFVGALLAKRGKVSIGYPGGDDFGGRPIDQHVKALRAMGAKFTFHQDRYEVEAERLTGADIYFDMITSGATIHAMLAAVLAEGETVLRNAAKDPEVVDAANFLNQMGAQIRGAGTDTIRINGVKQLGGCTYTVIPDRLIAGAFLMAAGANGGTVTVDGIIPEHLNSCIAKLREIGIDTEVREQSITASCRGPLKAVRVRASMYPGFATDLQQPLTALLLRASGKSIVTDKVFPKRFNHVPQLRRMGAHIEMRGNTAFIEGQRPLQGAVVHASDVRAGTCLILAGLMAEGKTYITGVEHIERGYENVIEAFAALGAKLNIREGTSPFEMEEEACLRRNDAIRF